MQKARGHTGTSTIVLPLLVSRRFQGLFHSGPPVLFTFPSRYWFTIGHRVVFSLGRWSSQIPTRFHVPRGTRGHPRVTQDFAYGTITPYGRAFQLLLLYMYFVTLQPHCNTTKLGPTTPIMQRLQTYTYSVWALPRSLAATDGISVDFSSCRYLDVSIPCVRLVHLWIQCTMTGYHPGRVPPFGVPRIKAC